jgi:Alr-MurF fusion protein
MSSYSVKKVAEIVHGTLIGSEDYKIEYLVTDSRKIVFPNLSLFFAIKGFTHDGNKYIPELYEHGVRAFLTSEKPVNISEYNDVVFIIVNDVVEALQNIASYHRSLFKGEVVAITGSNGKTVVKEWIYQAVQMDKNVVRSPRSFNSQIGVPLSVWQMEKEHDIALIEAGISLPGEMEKLERIIKPTIGIITNVGEPHQENFKDYQHKCIEKLKLFLHCRELIYCKDHEIIENELQKPEYKSIKKHNWSRKGNATVWLKDVVLGEKSTSLVCQYSGVAYNFEIPFSDEASLENCLQLITLLFVLGYRGEEIGLRLKLLTPVAMRLELKQGINNCTIINDTYNSDFGSLAIALDALVHQKQHTVKTLILSDILQSGRPGDDLYEAVSKLIKQKSINRFIGIGPELSKYKSKFGSHTSFYASTQDFLNEFKRESFIDETILLKGSRTFEFEKILKLFEKKVHETVLEINLDAMAYNLNYFRSRLKPGVKMVAMVKAFSYGSGSFEIANMLQFQRIDYLAVAIADEGVALRESGVTTPIMVMNPEKTTFSTLVNYKLEPEIYSFRILEDFSKFLESQNVKQFPIHVKLDTGMHRLGFMEQEIDRLVEVLKGMESIKVQSIFSHLAGADDEGFDPFTQQQIKVFEKGSTKIMQAMPYKVLRHILNSAGIERFPQSQYDMVRLGIGLYGISALNQFNVRNISTLKTVILQIKNIPISETVGYSRKFLAKQETRIGILPIGYADGLHRCVGNGVGRFMVNGHYVPVIGNICMDMCMIDLTGIEASEGDEVIIFGDNCPVSDLAKKMNTIPYEVLTSISPRVKRIYYQEGD